MNTLGIGGLEIYTFHRWSQEQRRKQTIELGGSACKACGLRIEVRAEEPRCRQCGYLLYRLTSDTCPECGTPIHRDAPATTG